MKKPWTNSLQRQAVMTEEIFLFHKMLLEGKLPLTIGGGIGQSRICMLLLGKVHVGEVQASLWDEETLKACKKAGIEIL